MAVSTQATTVGFVLHVGRAPPRFPRFRPRAAMGARTRAKAPRLGMHNPWNAPTLLLGSVWALPSVHIRTGSLRNTSGSGKLFPWKSEVEPELSGFDDASSGSFRCLWLMLPTFRSLPSSKSTYETRINCDNMPCIVHCSQTITTDTRSDHTTHNHS